MRSLGLSLAAFCCAACAAQIIPGAGPAAKPPAPELEPPTDAFGRSTPRGTVLGFLKAARKGDYESAVEYLNTPLKERKAAELARELFVVLDRRLPARLNEISDQPEGSMALLTRPDQDVIGTIASPNGDVQILVKRVTREKNRPVWLFSRETLDAIPDLYAEIDRVHVEHLLPAFLVNTRIFDVPLFEWIALFIGLPFLYLLTGLLRHALGSGISRMIRLFMNATAPDTVLLPQPTRLLVIALIIRWAVSRVSLPLIARHVWLNIAFILLLVTLVWFLVLFSAGFEGVWRRRLDRQNRASAIPILRLGRRTVDFLIVFSGLLVAFHHFGVNITAALAGLGVGGIAIALAAQKTLENVIGGMSVIFDRVIRVGDFVRTGTSLGSVEFIGLRSTRIRTLDRTVVSVPNGQLANANIENLTARDTFWFHHFLALEIETAGSVMRSVIDGVTELLTGHASVDRTSARITFLRLGASSLDLEIFAYVRARSFNEFLEIQQELLLRVLDALAAAGAQIALPSRTLYVASGSADMPRRTNRPDLARAPQTGSQSVGAGQLEVVSRP